MTTQVAKEAPAPTLFELKAQLLDQGRTMDLLAATEHLCAHIKVYAEGGENALHAHAEEEHLFVILAGEATFRLGKEEKLQKRGKYEGIMIPAGSLYWFVSSGTENLVMLRVGAKAGGWNSFDDRVDADGKPLPGDSAANKEVPVKVRPGAFFAS
jgi:mannose-6-phosphate isomerase-like protein (cupin superfamily)